MEEQVSDIRERMRWSMNPVFIILVILGAVALWFLLSFLFRPLGNMLLKIWEDAMNEMDEDEDE